MAYGSWRHGCSHMMASGMTEISLISGMGDSFMTGIAAFLEGIEKVEDAIMLDIMSDVVRSVVLDHHA